MSFQDDLQKWAAQAYYDADSRRVGEHIRRLLRGDDTGPIDPETNKGRPPEYLQAFPPDRQVSEEALLRGLYGIPLSAQNPGGWPPDLGALYNAPQGAWISDRTDGEAGNVYWSTVDDTITLSWLWGTDNPLAVVNACKYRFDAPSFIAGAYSRRIYNAGREIVQLPDGYACVGAAYNDAGYLLVAALTSSEIVAGYYPATRSAEDLIYIAANESLVAVATYPRSGLTQQVLFSPMADKAAAVYKNIVSDSSYNGWIELAWDFMIGVSCVITDHPDHTLDGFYVEYADTTQDDSNACVTEAFGTPWNTEVTPGSCVTVEGYECNPDQPWIDPFSFWLSARGSNAKYVGDTTEQKVKRKTRTVVGSVYGGPDVSHLIAIDWAVDGTRLDVRLTASGDSSFVEVSETGERTIAQQTGDTVATPDYQQFGTLPCIYWDLERNVSGVVDYLERHESFAEASQDGNADFTVNLEVNGVQIAALEEIAETYSFQPTKPPDGQNIGYDQSTYKREATPESSVIWTTEPCADPGLGEYLDEGMIMPFTGAAYDIVDTSEGTISACNVMPFYPNSPDWVPGGSSTCRDRTKGAVVFMDARAGVYAIHEKQGRLYELDEIDVFTIVSPSPPPGNLDTQDTTLIAEGETKDTASDPPPDAVHCITGVMLKGGYATADLGKSSEFFTPGDLSGAAERQGATLVSVVHSMGLGAAELRVSALYTPDGDPLALFGATGDDQAIRHISVI